MTETTRAHADAADALQVVELRQYTLEPGRRDELVELFERAFLETQEEHGITVLGQFRDLQRPDHFVWLRGFADMESRHRALEGFYGGPIWAEHKAAANDCDELATEHFPGFRGMTLRLFDPGSEQWAIYWAGPDTHQGRAVLSRFTWRRGPSPRWEQAFSADGGHTWETNWTMDFTPVA